VFEGENKGGLVKLEDLNGRGVDVNKDGSIWIGHAKEGKCDGLMRWIIGDGSL
jgi:hypothetical protein